MRTVVGLYDNFDDAQHVVDALTQAGFTDADMSLVSRDLNDQYTRTSDMNQATQNPSDFGNRGSLSIPGIGPVMVTGPLADTMDNGLISSLVDMGVPRDMADLYAEGVRRGDSLVVLRTSDEQTDDAVSIMNRYNPIDINGLADQWRRSGWQGFDENADEMSTEDLKTERQQYTRQENMQQENIPVTGDTVEDVNIPVVEEDLLVGKRQVDKGGVRINTYITEEPVQKDVHLREEHVNVERRPVDRPATDQDFNTFQEGTMEVRETAEEPVVEKRARVVEEVHVDKDVEERDQTIQDTVRRKDVDVQPINAGDWNRYEQGFRQDFQTRYGKSGRNFDYYLPAYRYGYDLAGNPRYQGYDWAQMEPVARREWESRGGQGAWNDIKDAVRYAWDKMTNKL